MIMNKRSDASVSPCKLHLWYQRSRYHH